MKHVFGIGTLPPYVDGHQRPAGGLVQLVLGPEQGRLLGGPGRAALHPLRGRHAGRAEAHTARPSSRGCSRCPPTVARRATRWQSYMFGYGRTSACPTTSTRSVGLDYAVMWWNPTDIGKGKIVFDDGTGRFRYSTTPSGTTPGSGRRASRSCSTRATRSRSSTRSPSRTPYPTIRARDARARRADRHRFHRRSCTPRARRARRATAAGRGRARRPTCTRTSGCGTRASSRSGSRAHDPRVRPASCARCSAASGRTGCCRT